MLVCGGCAERGRGGDFELSQTSTMPIRLVIKGQGCYPWTCSFAGVLLDANAIIWI